MQFGTDLMLGKFLQEIRAKAQNLADIVSNLKNKKIHEMYFSNSLIIHKENTKKINV